MNWKTILEIAENGNLAPERRVEKTEAEWALLLSPEEFRITRQHGTERPFSGELCSTYEPGRYSCICCGTVLFDSSEKFDSGTGWPSFALPVADNVIKYIVDNSYGMRRVEVQCNICDAHLGHVFPDGPPPSRLRYCINSLALKKED